jgi:hypothetical protein
VIKIPAIRIFSESNVREHWTKRNRRANGSKSKKKPTVGQRQLVRMMLDLNAKKPLIPCLIRLVRIAPRKLDQGNIAAALKHVQDGCADWIGIDDRLDTLVKYEYAQDKGDPEEYALRVEITETDAPAIVDAMLARLDWCDNCGKRSAFVRGWQHKNKSMSLGFCSDACATKTVNDAIAKHENNK